MTVQMTRTSPTTLTFTRSFTAPPARVWAAHIEPALIRQWMVGNAGMTMPVCETDPQPGGQLRFEWVNAATGFGFYVTGHYIIVDAPHRSIHTEIMYLPDPTPEITVETRFDANGTGTLLTMTMSAASAKDMEAVMASGITETDHMDASYDRLENAVSTAA